MSFDEYESQSYYDNFKISNHHWREKLQLVPLFTWRRWSSSNRETLMDQPAKEYQTKLARESMNIYRRVLKSRLFRALIIVWELPYKPEFDREKEQLLSMIEIERQMRKDRKCGYTKKWEIIYSLYKDTKTSITINSKEEAKTLMEFNIDTLEKNKQNKKDRYIEREKDELKELKEYAKDNYKTNEYFREINKLNKRLEVQKQSLKNSTQKSLRIHKFINKERIKSKEITKKRLERQVEYESWIMLNWNSKARHDMYMKLKQRARASYIHDLYRKWEKSSYNYDKREEERARWSRERFEKHVEIESRVRKKKWLKEVFYKFDKILF